MAQLLAAPVSKTGQFALGLKKVGLLLVWSTGQRWKIEMGFRSMGFKSTLENPDIHWLARDKGWLVAAMFETWT
jgi:hypothetical protein